MSDHHKDAPPKEKPKARKKPESEIPAMPVFQSIPVWNPPPLPELPKLPKLPKLPPMPGAEEEESHDDEHEEHDDEEHHDKSHTDPTGEDHSTDSKKKVDDTTLLLVPDPLSKRPVRGPSIPARALHPSFENEVEDKRVWPVNASEDPAKNLEKVLDQLVPIGEDHNTIDWFRHLGQSSKTKLKNNKANFDRELKYILHGDPRPSKKFLGITYQKRNPRGFLALPGIKHRLNQPSTDGLYEVRDIFVNAWIDALQDALPDRLRKEFFDVVSIVNKSCNEYLKTGIVEDISTMSADSVFKSWIIDWSHIFIANLDAKENEENAKLRRHGHKPHAKKRYRKIRKYFDDMQKYSA